MPIYVTIDQAKSMEIHATRDWAKSTQIHATTDQAKSMLTELNHTVYILMSTNSYSRL